MANQKAQAVSGQEVPENLITHNPAEYTPSEDQVATGAEVSSEMMPSNAPAGNATPPGEIEHFGWEAPVAGAAAGAALQGKYALAKPIVKKMMGIKPEVAPPPKKFLSPFDVSQRNIQAAKATSPNLYDSTQTVYNWAKDDKNKGGQFAGEFLGGQNYEDAYARRQAANAVEQSMPGHRVLPGQGFVVPQSTADAIKAENAQKLAQHEALTLNQANQAASMRAARLAEQRELLQKQAGKNKLMSIGKGGKGAAIGALVGLGAMGYDALKPEGKASGGAVGHFSEGSNVPGKAGAALRIGKGLAEFLVKPTTGFLENTPKKPNPLVGTRFETKDLGGIAPEKPTSLEELRGSAMNITPWDATHRNKQILSVSGRPLTDEIISHGGTPYARDIEHIRKGVAGASSKVISGRIQKRADIASKEGEKAKGTGEVVMLPSSMGKWSEDFAIPTFQTYMDLFKQAEHSPETIAKQTEYLRQLTKDKKPLFSNLLSLDNPDVMKQFLTGEGLAGSPGDARKAFIRLQRLKDNQRALGVNAEDISAAHTIPEIASLPRGFAGNTVIQMKPGAKTQPSNNETYDTDFLGNYLGNLGSHTPVPVLLNKPYTSAFSEMRARYPDEPEGKIHQMALGALERRNAGVSEVVDDEMINRVGQFHEGVKQGKIDPTDIHGALEYLKTPGLYAEGGEVGHFADGRGVPKLPGKAGSLLRLLGLSDEAIEAWQKANKVSQRQTRVPQVQQAAQALREGQISAKEYRDIVQQYMPIKPFTSVPNMPTPQEMAMALHSNKLEKGLIESNLSLPKGTRVGSRLDIPAYEDYDKWVASIHEGSKSGGNALGYAQTAHLTGDKGPIQFMSSPKAGLNIAVGTNPKTGESVNKSTIARIHGDWEGTPSEDVYKRSQDLLGHPDWAQVGMNPFRHSYFYDKADMTPVVGAEEVLQVGPLVLAKKPKKADPDDPQFRIDKDDPKSQSFKSGGGAWTRSEGKNPEGGLNAVGRASLKAQGHDIKPPQPEGGSRKDSFCARMGGMKKKLTSSETANDPDSRINKALRKWKC